MTEYTITLHKTMVVSVVLDASNENKAIKKALELAHEWENDPLGFKINHKYDTSIHFTGDDHALWIVDDVDPPDQEQEVENAVGDEDE